MFLKAISDSLHGNLKSCSGDHKAAVERTGKRMVGEISVKYM